MINEVYKDGFIGKNVCNFGYDFDVFFYCGVGVYVCGEEIFLIEFFEGKFGKFCLKFLFFVVVGFFGCLFIVVNVEIVVVVFIICCCGGDWFVGFGCECN